MKVALIASLCLFICLKLKNIKYGHSSMCVYIYLYKRLMKYLFFFGAKPESKEIE